VADPGFILPAGARGTLTIIRHRAKRALELIESAQSLVEDALADLNKADDQFIAELETTE